MRQLKIICWQFHFLSKPLLFDLPYFSEKLNLSHLVFGIPELEKEMATHSNTLAWKIPWTEEPDRQRFEHD